jgi:hypothetical protein
MTANTFQGPYSFAHRGSPQGCDVLNEVELMYPEASIKLRSFPTNSSQSRVEIANKVSWKFDKCFTQTIRAINRGVLLDPSFILSLKRLSMKNRQPQKSQWGSFKRLPMKKEATPKNAKGLVQKTSDRKRGNQKKPCGHLGMLSHHKMHSLMQRGPRRST